MKYKQEDLRDMPKMIDKIDIFLYSHILVRPVTDSYYEDIGLSKKIFTENTRKFIGNHEVVTDLGDSRYKINYDIIEDVRLSGTPRFSFKPSFFEDNFCSRVLFKGYNRFVIRIFGNTIRFMRREFEKNDWINKELDDKYRIHDTNYFYPQLMYDDCPILVSEFEEESRMYLPNLNPIGEYVNFEVMGDLYFGTVEGVLNMFGLHEQLTRMWNSDKGRKELKEYDTGGIFNPEFLGKVSCNYIEVNQDLLLPDPIGKSIMRGIKDFFVSDLGNDYIASKGISVLSYRDNREYDGVQIILILPKGLGRYKIYCKTNYTIRREICLYGKDIQHIFKKKGYNLVVKWDASVGKNVDGLLFKELIDKAFGLIDLKAIVSNDVDIKQLGYDLILAYSKMPKDEKRFWYKVMRNVYLSRSEIPKSLKKLTQRKHIYNHVLKRGKWMYELKPELREQYGII